ncbi:MAG: metalloregulator ArsR/SmtB family transcription factor [Pseudomonadota bacterium]
MTYRLQGIFGAIADPHRRQILDYLMVSDLTAGEIAQRFDISRPAVAKHLKVLEDNDLIRITRRGRERVHQLNPEPLLTVSQWLSRYERFWDVNLIRLKALVEAPGQDDEGKD